MSTTHHPGHVNAHTHLYSGLVPLGMPAPDPPPSNFVQILERVWWRLDRALDEASLRAAARLYVAEALLAGTTALVDHHESPGFIEGSLDVLADACQELGMRAVLCYGATERNGGRAEARRGLVECRRFLKENDRPLVRGAVGLHASFTVSDETIVEAGALCREQAAILHLHVAEDVADVTDAAARGYEGPLERLLTLDALPTGSLLAHGVHLGAEQVRRASEQGLWLVQNPRSNRGNGVGYPQALAYGERVALGTDGYPASMTEELAVGREEAAQHGETPTALQDRLAAGQRLMREIFGEDALAEDHVATTAGRLAHVQVAGRHVVWDGKLMTGDLEEIRAEAAGQSARLWERMEKL